MDQIIRIGMDTSKHVFQLHGVNAAEEAILRKKLRRQDLVAFFGKLPPTVVALEACGGSHHWARLLQLDLLRKTGEPLMKQEDFHAPHALYEGVSGRGCAARPDQRP